MLKKFAFIYFSLLFIFFFALLFFKTHLKSTHKTKIEFLLQNSNEKPEWRREQIYRTGRVRERKVVEKRK